MRCCSCSENPFFSWDSVPQLSAFSASCSWRAQSLSASPTQPVTDSSKVSLWAPISSSILHFAAHQTISLNEASASLPNGCRCVHEIKLHLLKPLLANPHLGNLTKFLSSLSSLHYQYLIRSLTWSSHSMLASLPDLWHPMWNRAFPAAQASTTASSLCLTTHGTYRTLLLIWRI